LILEVTSPRFYRGGHLYLLPTPALTNPDNENSSRDLITAGEIILINYFLNEVSYWREQGTSDSMI